MNIVNELQPEHLAYWSDFETKVCTFTAPEEREVGIEPATGIVTAPREPADLGVSCVRVAWRPDEADIANLSTEVRAVCASCPVRRPCGDYADATDPEGVWAGLSQRERRRAKQGRGAA